MGQVEDDWGKEYVILRERERKREEMVLILCWVWDGIGVVW